MSDLPRGEAALTLHGIWDRTLLRQLAEINAQLLERLVQAAAADAVDNPLIGELRADWLQLTGERRIRLADCPYLLIDAAFASPGHWLRVADSGVRDAATLCRPRNSISLLSPGLLRPALVLAWHLARSNPLLARVALGMDERSAVLIAGCRLQDLEALAEIPPYWIQIRWEDQPGVWQQLLRASAAQSEQLLRQLQLRGLQLLAAGLSPRVPG